MKIKNIHHVSSIVGHAQRNVDFNVGVLGQKLVKKTLNYDDASHYHLYFGNENGSKGLTTTFPWNDAVDGHHGNGQMEAIIYAIPLGSMPFWKERLSKFGIDSDIITVMNEAHLRFSDPDGLVIEMFESKHVDPRAVSFDDISKKEAIQGIYGAVLFSNDPEASQKFLMQTLGYDLIEKEDFMIRLEVPGTDRSTLYLNLQKSARARMGVGAVHHIAFEVEDDAIDAWRERLIDAGMEPTEVKDRNYFKSLYFREPGGILVELATSGPGILIDENEESLGTHLIMPPHFKHLEKETQENLMPIFTRKIQALIDYGYRDRYEYEMIQKKRAYREVFKILLHKSKKETLSQKEIDEMNALRQKIVMKR